MKTNEQNRELAKQMTEAAQAAVMLFEEMTVAFRLASEDVIRLGLFVRSLRVASDAGRRAQRRLGIVDD